MEDINETYKVLGKITFCRKLVWTFGNEREERTPEVLKAHWWNTLKKVFDEQGNSKSKLKGIEKMEARLNFSM